MSDLPLFRPDAAAARAQRLEGEILLVQPVRTNIIVLLIVAIVGAAILWLSLGSYTRTETARGMLVTRETSAKVVALRPGRIVRMLVREGERVGAGQRLALVQTEETGVAGESAVALGLEALERQRLLTAEQARLAARRAQSDRDRLAAALAGIRQQRADVSAQIGIQDQVVASAGEIYERVARLLDRGFISRVEIERRRQAHLAARQQLAQLHQQRNALAAEEARTGAELGRFEADAGSEIVAAGSSAQMLAQQGARLRSERAYAITAPVAGRVAALQTAAGRSVDASVPLMEISPEDSPLAAQVYAPTRAIGFVRPGQEVRLLYDAFPYQRFGSFEGRILAVSRVAIDPRQLSAPLQVDEPVYRIDIALGGQSVAAFGEPVALQPGMMLSASIVLDRRSFLDWLLTPLNAVLQRSGGG
ncbi:MAG TPA: HlyD family efflux transporter periplasmic adaptor subunit [Allosphingosinicella sp.]